MKFPDGTDRQISISGGFCCTQDSEADLADLLQWADEALYRVKRSEKGELAEYQQ